MKVLIIGVLAAMAATIAPAAGQGQSSQPAGAPAPKVRSLRSKAEQQALQAVLHATTNEARILAADDFVTKFPKSDFRGLALWAEAQAYQQKNDYVNMVVYAERVLESDPDDATKAQTMAMLALAIAQHTGEFDLDREEKLGRVEKYADGALDILKTLPKPNASVSDEEWNSFKGQMAADAHDALGMDAMIRKNVDGAIKEFKTSIDATKAPSPSTEMRLAAAYNQAGKYDDALALCDKALNAPNLNPQIQRVALAERSRAMGGKGAGPKAGAPAAAAPAPAPKP